MPENVLLYKGDKDKSVFLPVVILLFFAILAYWQVFFLVNSLQWDQIDCYLPWRYFTSESIRNHVFPFWNPYQDLGYPIHADLRSIWSPEVWIVSLFGGYTNYTLHFIFIFYIFLAGYGMYRLALNLGIKPLFSLIAGISYMLSGYFTGHAQEMFSIAGGSLLPFVLLHYLKLLEYSRIKDVIAFTVFMFLMITCGYQALVIILFYLILLFFIVKSTGLLWEKNFRQFARLCLLNILAVVFILAACTGLIISAYQALPYLSRLEGLELHSAQFGAFTPQCMISYLLPFAVVKDIAFFDTDLSMTNSYAGFFIFIFFIFSLFRKKSVTEIVLLGFGFFALLASFGSYLPVREWLYRFVPGMNLFRFPSFFSLFMLVAIILTGTRRLEDFIKDPLKNNKILFFIIIVIISIAGGFLNFALKNADFSHPGILSSDPLKNSTFTEHILINVLIIVILFIVFVILFKRKKLRNSTIFLLVSIDMVIAVQLNSYYTVCSPDTKPSQMHKILKEQPRGFPVPALIAVAENHDGGTLPLPFWRNTNIFRKQISADGFNSFQLRNFQEFNEKHALLRDSVLKNPFIYFSDRISSVNSADSPAVKTQLCMENRDIKILKHIQLKHDSADRFTFISFSPVKTELRTQTLHAQIITCLQNNYPGWEVRIDGRLARHFTSNFMFISVLLPAGEHQVTFSYDNPLFYYGYIVSYAVFLILLILLLGSEFWCYRKRAMTG